MRVLTPEALFNHWLHKPVVEFKKDLIYFAARDFTHNTAVIQRKWWLVVAISVVFLAQVACLIAGVLTAGKLLMNVLGGARLGAGGGGRGGSVGSDGGRFGHAGPRWEKMAMPIIVSPEIKMVGHRSGSNLTGSPRGMSTARLVVPARVSPKSLMGPPPADRPVAHPSVGGRVMDSMTTTNSFDLGEVVMEVLRPRDGHPGAQGLEQRHVDSVSA
ncbi:MAG: hypothetical protein MZV65_32100 [Chromatiales bacterium]|nr:hypothetical protein [Chromatiales bacterium]